MTWWYWWQLQYQRQWQWWHNDIDDNDYIKGSDKDDIDDNDNIEENYNDDMVVRFLALQKMVEEKKAEAEKMNMKVAQDPAALDLVHQVLLQGVFWLVRPKND